MFPPGRFLSTDVDTLGGVAAPGNAVARLNKLSALGRQTNDGLVPKLAGLEIVGTVTATATMANLDGVVPGARVYEAISRVQLAPNQWIKKFSHDISAKSLRRIVNHELGREGHLVAADIPDADGAISRTISVIIPFWSQNSFEEGDTSPDCVNVGDGTLELSVAQYAIDGLTVAALSAGARVTAYYYWGKPGVPVFRVMQERAIESQIRFRMNLQGDRLKTGFLISSGSAAATGTATNLPGSFDPAATQQLTLNGQRYIEDTRTDDLIRQYNNVNYDAAIDESVTAPEIVPIVSQHRNMKSTKAPNGAGDSWVEFNADPRAASSNTTNANVVTDELFGARAGSAAVEAYRAASATRVRGVLVHKTASKVEGVSAMKADALPLIEAVPRNVSRKV